MAMTVINQLTQRQRDCLRAVADHRTYKEIARELGISDSAVEKHLRAAREKLGVDSTAAAARLFLVHEDGAEALPHGGFQQLSKAGGLEEEAGVSRDFDRLNHGEEAGAHLFGASDHDRPLSPLQTLSLIGRVVLGTIAGLSLLIASAEGLKAVLT